MSSASLAVSGERITCLTPTVLRTIATAAADVCTRSRSSSFAPRSSRLRSGFCRHPRTLAERCSKKLDAKEIRGEAAVPYGSKHGQEGCFKVRGLDAGNFAAMSEVPAVSKGHPLS
jgi:hypothetical protein